METITRRIFCILRKLEYGSFLSASVGAMSIVVSPLGTKMDSGIQSSCWAPQQACSSCIFVNQKTDTRKGSKDKYSRDYGRDNSGLSCPLMRLPTPTATKATRIIIIIKKRSERSDYLNFACQPFKERPATHPMSNIKSL